MTTSKPQERDNIGTASKGGGERERERARILFFVRQGQQPQDWHKSLIGGKISTDPRQARILDLQVKHLAPYRLG